MAVYEMKKKLNPSMEMGSYGTKGRLWGIQGSRGIIWKVGEAVRIVAIALDSY